MEKIYTYTNREGLEKQVNLDYPLIQPKDRYILAKYDYKYIEELFNTDDKTDIIIEKIFDPKVGNVTFT
jgi:hypothetical protein